MIHLRTRHDNILEYDICCFGTRFRESSRLIATPANQKKLEKHVKQMNAELALGVFDYAEHFPESKKLEKYARLRRAKQPGQVAPLFSDYAQQWFERKRHEWKVSYCESLESTLSRYLLPEFGNTIVSDITLAQVQRFRSKLCERINNEGGRCLSNKRINIILVPLISLLYLASEEWDFEYPLKKLKPLREEPSDPRPMTQQQVKSFLSAVQRNWHDYFLVRFHTGMRSCEIHGLQLENIDFEHQLIHIRFNYVRGRLTDVKTPKSRRDIVMTPTVAAALKRTMNSRAPKGNFVFNSQGGKPVTMYEVSNKVWYPTLEKIGIAPRTPYVTRHTAAVLHLAAHENPLFVSRLLGHSSTRMLYDVYAPYVVDAVRNDGSAFERLMQ